MGLFICSNPWGSDGWRRRVAGVNILEYPPKERTPPASRSRFNSRRSPTPSHAKDPNKKACSGAFG